MPIAARFVLPILISLGLLGVAEAQSGKNDLKNDHGGVTSQVEKLQFEVVFERRVVRVFVFDEEGNPVDPKGASGKLTIAFSSKRNRQKAKLKYVKSRKPGKKRKGMPGHFAGGIDLRQVAEESAAAKFSISKLPGTGKGAVAFKVTFKLARLFDKTAPKQKKPAKFIFACPMHPKVTSHSKTDKCWECKMGLNKRKEK